MLLIGLHILRVFVWGAYKYPRELAWVGGALLFFVILGFGFTGYLLPWDQKAYWATVVGTNIAGSAPLIGGGVLELLRGGQQLGAVTLTRFYGIHIWVLPATLAILVVFHLFGVIRQGIAASPRRKPLTEPAPRESRRETYEREYAAEKSTGKPFWDALIKDAIVALFVVAARRDRRVCGGRAPGGTRQPQRDQLRAAARVVLPGPVPDAVVLRRAAGAAHRSSGCSRSVG